MSRIESLEALRRANPRHAAGFDDTVTAVAMGARPRIEPVPHDALAAGAVRSAPQASVRPKMTRARRRTARLPVASALVATAAAAALLLIGVPFGSSAVDPADAMQRAVAASAAAADDSGTASVEITQDGNLWAAKTVQWNGADLSLRDGAPTRTGRGEFRLVGGTMYAEDPEQPGMWQELGPPDSIDPGSGTTPDEYLTAAREDAGGSTLRRITESVTELTVTHTGDGSTVYAGRVPAGALARGTGFKEGEALRLLPYGYVAHDDAAAPGHPISVRIIVDGTGTVREIAAEWGGASAWTYRVAFRDLGATPPLAVPDNVQPLRPEARAA
jgi:hypothetical protein